MLACRARILIPEEWIVSSSPKCTENHFFHLPKVDLHRHLEGSIRLSTITELSRKGLIDLPADETRLQRRVQMSPGEARSPANFLQKFKSVRDVFSSPEIIQRVTQEAVEDAAADNVAYLEIHFTPVALAQTKKFDLEDVFRWVLAAGREQAERSGLELGFIASINRHEPLREAEEVAALAAEYYGRGVVGLGLAGNEAGFESQPFAALFREAARSGLGITIHAGEWAGAESVRSAILDFGAPRIGHGIRILENSYITAMARECGTVFEVCLTSNMDSGIVSALPAHPLGEMIGNGLLVTLNSDDPSICRTTLSREYSLAYFEQGLTEETIHRLILRALDTGFLSEGKAVLKRRISEGVARAVPLAASIHSLQYSFGR